MFFTSCFKKKKYILTVVLKNNLQVSCLYVYVFVLLLVISLIYKMLSNFKYLNNLILPVAYTGIFLKRGLQRKTSTNPLLHVEEYSSIPIGTKHIVKVIHFYESKTLLQYTPLCSSLFII